jgi:hypothetical protein
VTPTLRDGESLRVPGRRAYRRRRPHASASREGPAAGRLTVEVTGLREDARMRKLANMLRRHAFHLLLLFVALIVFAKPVLLTTPDEHPLQVLLEFFVPWAAIIVVLLWIGRSLARSEGDPPEPRD